VAFAGLTRGSYNTYRRRGLLPRADEAVAIAAALGTTVEFLVTGKTSADWQLPPDLAPIIEDLAILDATELGTVKVMVHPLAEARRSQMVSEKQSTTA